MEQYKNSHANKSREYRPYGGRQNMPPLRIPPETTTVEEDDDPITPGSIHSAWPGWYVSPFEFKDDHEEEW